MELVSKVLFATLIACCSSSYTANETGLRALTDYDCGCLGQNASFICTASGGVFTVWGGTAFNCDSSEDKISLTHIDFQTTMGQCNDGAIVGYGIENVNNSYISRLDVRLMSTDLQGQTIICSVDNGSSVITLGNETLIVSTVSVPPPPPERISTLVANSQELMFSWNQTEYNCPMLHYNFTSEKCGNCTEVTSRVVSCTGFQTSSAGIACNFTVSSIVCGNITGPRSMQSANVILKVPDAPTVQSLPRYLDGHIQILIGLMTTFPIVASPFVSSEIDGSVNNYTIHYSDSTFRSSCGIASISASSCVGGTCTHNFDILNNSSCPPTTSIFVSVVASNVFGSSPLSTPLVKEGLNNLVNVNFDANRRTITCTFLNQPRGIMKQCSANITYDVNCEQFLNTFSGKGTGDTVETRQLDVVPGVIEYCFLVTAKTSNVTVLVEGTLQNIQNIIDSQANATAAIAVPLVFVLLVLILLIILVAVAAMKYSKSTKLNARSTVRVGFKFSIEDKPGSLAKALKVFKDNNINILGLNTHLHHADFDRNAGKEYKFNYIHCMCTKEDKEFLENKLKAEFEGATNDQDEEINDEAVIVTATIKVKDSPGALWEAIYTIGEHGINIDGVNTRSDRESIKGYKDNYVKCCCSEDSLQKVRTELKMLTGKEVKIEFLDEVDHGEERAIEYLVRDEVGALASTLQVVSDMGINISGVNLDHLPEGINRTPRRGLKINFIECFIDRSTKVKLFNKLMGEYGAVKVELQTDNLDASRDSVVKVTIQNETGSLNRILKAFHDLNININGVNILEPAFKRERKIPYSHYHLEITATNEQEMNLKKRLLAQGLAIGISRFNLAKYQQTDVQNVMSPSDCESEESASIVETDDPPTIRRIQFYVRNEVGALFNALQVFSELGINITKVNPAHLSQEHENEFVECSCPEIKRESLIDKLKSYGATKAELLPEAQQDKVFTDVNYCVVKFSIPEVGAIVKVLEAFPDAGATVLKVNPPHIKIYDQYVECCCTEEEKTKLLSNLEEIHGVTHVTFVSESKVSVKPIDDPNYRIIKYSVGDNAGTIVKALKVFHDLKINIIGVNTLKPTFDRAKRIKFKHNHVMLRATDDQEEELKHKLLVTGLAIDVKPYERVQRSDNSESLQPENMGRNDIPLTNVRVQND